MSTPVQHISSVTADEKISIFWFRRDLRTEDNAGLFQALSASEKVLPIFIFDTSLVENPADSTDPRVLFILSALNSIDIQLRQLGSSVLILTGNPLEVFRELSGTQRIHAVYANEDYEPYAIKRDDKIASLLATKGIPFHIFQDQVIFAKNEVVKSDGKPYTVFTPYSNVWKKKFLSVPMRIYDSKKLLRNCLNFSPTYSNDHLLTREGIHKYFTQPGIPGNIIKTYDQTRNFPSIEGTSKLSHHLRFGTISVRKLAGIATDLNGTFLNELIWREFFMMILWHFPAVVVNSFRSRYDAIFWRNNEEEFVRWCRGETGFPMVDAGMRELNETGWMHNRVRMVTASFLVKHLLVDWRQGEAYFAQKLLDYELSSNNGNWQWAAGCGCDAAPYFRVFNPTEQMRKFDPDQLYVKKWVPEFGTSRYASPIVDHDYARKRAIEVYKKALIG